MRRGVDFLGQPFFCSRADEASAKDEARRHVQSGQSGYSNADLVVKFAGWEPGCGQPIAQASLSALKQLILSDKQLPGTPERLLLPSLRCKNNLFKKTQLSIFYFTQLYACGYTEFTSLFVDFAALVPL